MAGLYTSHVRNTQQKINVNIVATEEFPPKTVDLTTELLRLQKNGAEYVVMQMLPAAIITAFKSADRINYNPIFLGTWTSTDPDFFKLGKGLIRDRLRIQFPGGLPSDGSAGIKIMEDLWQRYKTVEKFDASYWEGVVIGMIMERAFTRANELYKDINRETINKAMESFNNEDFGGIVPNITYTANDHEGSFKARIVKVGEDGTFTPLTNFYNPLKEKITIKEVTSVFMKAYRGKPSIFDSNIADGKKAAELEVNNLSLNFGGVTALHNIDISVHTGELGSDYRA